MATVLDVNMNKTLKRLAERWPTLPEDAIKTLAGVVERSGQHELRDLTVSQKAMLAAELATLEKGATKKYKPGAMTQLEVARAMGVSVALLKKALAVKKSAKSKIVTLAKSGKLNVFAAYKQLHDKGLPEKHFYAPFAKWLKQSNRCARATSLGGSGWPGSKWATPDVVGTMSQFPPKIVAAEIKVDMSQLVSAFGQACYYRLFAHKSYLVVPAKASKDEIDRACTLCRMFRIGLVLFDCKHPKEPDFHIRVPALKNEPNKTYYKQCWPHIEKRMNHLGG